MKAPKGVDPFRYYRQLFEIMHGPYDKIIKTTAWHKMDQEATPDQKARAEAQARAL